MSHGAVTANLCHGITLIRILSPSCTSMIMVRFGHSPLAGLTNVRVTDEQIRRSLTTQTLTKLLRTAMDGPVRIGMTGWERSTLYWLASETGFRANELRSLKASSFSLDTEPATVAVQASAAKNDRYSRLSITPELVARMRELLRGKVPSAPAFKMPTKTAMMLRYDLKEAGIPYIDEQGEKFDFHSLRVQCASSLARANVHVKVMQERLRHSTSKLTLDIYSRLSQSEQDAAAVEALPRLALGA
ncbi:MAG: tyrosine-type recombinase/integrase [Phycisphaerales bacterium]